MVATASASRLDVEDNGRCYAPVGRETASRVGLLILLGYVCTNDLGTGKLLPLSAADRYSLLSSFGGEVDPLSRWQMPDTAPTVEEFTGLKLASLGEQDIAEINLACAKDLPGSESIDVPKILVSLDEMAAHVEQEIQRNYHHFLRDPGQSGNSQARYCVLMLITVLQQDFGVRYNPDRIRDPDFRNSGDLFIHGMLDGEGGTCASMPVLYTTIGRRLGWPIKLSHARGHVFCRWDDPDGHHPFGHERFNIEGSSLGGHIFSDEYYLTWPEPIPDGAVEQGIYLKSLSPQEELASFLSLRGHCLFDHQRIGDARVVYHWSRLLAPNDPHYESFYQHSEFVRDRLLEERTLRDYYGPDVPLPFGLFPRYVLRKMAADMLVAIHHHSEALQTAEMKRQEQQREQLQQMMMPRRIGAGGVVYQIEHLPNGQTISIAESDHTSPFQALSVNSATASAVAAGFDNHANVGIGTAVHEFPDHLLPAWFLPKHDSVLMLRRQEAMSFVKSLPPGAVIKQPDRIALKAPSGQTPHLEHHPEQGA
ncbi:MAG: hypothetical protein HZA46_21555 [Planctomycetales bacterium]|nr:hypothetical protein [Planctomycetales bacterium]